MINTFEDLGLNLDLVNALKKDGITIPTEIQKEAIPKALLNKDIIGESETGSGKTLVYLLSLFQKIDTDKREMQAIILCPTHELAMQIDNEVKNLSDKSGMPVKSVAIIGEVNIQRQIEKLKDKPHIIVGSTGRILELIKKKKINAQTVKTIVIDEGDRLLDEDNLSSVKDVIKTTMRDRQLMVFSATINSDAMNISKNIMKEPEVIKIEDRATVNPNIEHMYLTCEKRDKIEILRKLIASINPEKAIVFLNKMEEIELITSKLQFHHISAYGIYGSAEKEERKKALEGLRNGKIKILIASDLAARGLDIKDVTHIFNMDIPNEPKDYLHRVGRTGRAGKSGVAISIVTENEIADINRLEREFNIKITSKEMYRGKIVDHLL